MKKLWLHSIRAYLRLGMFFYFRRIQIHNTHNVPKNKAVLFLANHQNALLDPLLIASKSGRFSYFLTRAGVFKKSFVSKILKSLQMLPVYRVRDGWNTIANNNAVFEACTQLLSNKEAVVIFPEGSHNLARRVRVLSKGFTRIVFDTLERYPDLDLQLVPIGVNYVSAKTCPDSAAIYFGEPISANSFLKSNRHNNVKELKIVIHEKLTELTTHIPEEHYKEDLKKLEDLNIDFLNPELVNTCIKNNFENCNSIKKSNLNGLRRLFRTLLIINLFLPYTIWKLLVQPKIKELEFTSTFRFAVAITLVPVYLLIICLILSNLLTLNIAVSYLLVSLLLSLIAVKL